MQNPYSSKFNKKSSVNFAKKKFAELAQTFYAKKNCKEIYLYKYSYILFPPLNCIIL